MIICVQYWRTPYPEYGKEYFPHSVFREQGYFPYTVGLRHGMCFLEPIAIWKIKKLK